MTVFATTAFDVAYCVLGAALAALAVVAAVCARRGRAPLWHFAVWALAGAFLGAVAVGLVALGPPTILALLGRLNTDTPAFAARSAYSISLGLPAGAVAGAWLGTVLGLCR